MDKLLKKAAIYLVVTDKKEDNYFISEKIKRIKEKCERNDTKITHVFVNFFNLENNYLECLYNNIRKYDIDILITEEENLELEGIELEHY